VALVRVRVYFRHLLPTASLYIYLQLLCVCVCLSVCLCLSVCVCVRVCVCIVSLSIDNCYNAYLRLEIYLIIYRPSDRQKHSLTDSQTHRQMYIHTPPIYTFIHHPCIHTHTHTHTSMCRSSLSTIAKSIDIDFDTQTLPTYTHAYNT
jgi:hypothetical protein